MDMNLKGQYAGFVSRFLAYFIDIIVIAAILVGLGWFLNTIADLFPLDIIPGGNFRIFVAGAVAIFLVAFYFIFFWSLIGQTPGKMLLGLRVVSTDGGPITFWQAVRRFLGYLVSFILYLGYIWIIIDNHRQGWHDKIAGTYVIYVWDARFGSIITDRLTGGDESGGTPQD